VTCQSVCALLPIINDSLLATNLSKATVLINDLVVEIVSINSRLDNGTVVTANPDMERRALQAAAHLSKDAQALGLVGSAINKLSQIIDEIKANTEVRKTRHRNLQQLATGMLTDLS
jgi:hypothetical protein